MAGRVARADAAVKCALRRRWTARIASGLALAMSVACHRGTAAVSRSSSPAADRMLVVVVRHAEKAPEPANDPVLSAAGMARARALDSALSTLAITDVVVSHLQRTRLTAAPFIERTHAQLHVVPIGAAGVAAHVHAVADTVRAISRMLGRVGVLVVGHSNTVTLIVDSLSHIASPALCDSQYSQLFTVRQQSNSQAPMTMTRVSYGVADVPDPACATPAAGMLRR